MDSPTSRSLLAVFVIVVVIISKLPVNWLATCKNLGEDIVKAMAMHMAVTSRMRGCDWRREAYQQPSQSSFS